MIRFVVAIRDRAMDSFGNPIFVVAIGQAIRSFSDEVNRKAPDNALAAHPEDYDMFVLGEFDDVTGLFSGGPPKQIAIGKDLVINK
jgi:hypothetical protein